MEQGPDAAEPDTQEPGALQGHSRTKLTPARAGLTALEEDMAFDDGGDRFDVGAGFVMPNLNKLLPRDGQLDKSDHRIETTYFDTPGGDLVAFGITLYRAAGGDGTGWRLRMPDAAGDLEFSADSDQPTLPDALAHVVTGLCAPDSLSPVAATSTTRTMRQLLDAQGEQLLGVADDQVHASSPEGEPAEPEQDEAGQDEAGQDEAGQDEAGQDEAGQDEAGQAGSDEAEADEASVGRAGSDKSGGDSWRRVQVELGAAGDGRLLTSVRHRILAAGARPALRTDFDRLTGREPAAADTTTAGGVALAYLSEQFDEVARCDLRLRDDQPVIHRFRVALRRIRSTLRVYSELFDPEQSAALSQELVWLAGLLGEVRDREVLLERLVSNVQALPADLVFGAVSAHIETTLLLERKEHRERLVEAMDSERHAALVNAIRTWRRSAPVTELAAKPASTLQRSLRRTERKLAKSLRQAGGDMDGLHSARKVAKRLRYAAELAQRGDKQGSKVIKSATKQQDKLGEHQDSVVGAEFLRRVGAAAGSQGDLNGFTYGILFAEERARAQKIEQRAARRGGRSTSR